MQVTSRPRNRPPTKNVQYWPSRAMADLLGGGRRRAELAPRRAGLRAPQHRLDVEQLGDPAGDRGGAEHAGPARRAMIRGPIGDDIEDLLDDQPDVRVAVAEHHDLDQLAVARR